MWCASDALIHCCLHRNMPKACPYVMMRFLFALSDNAKYWFFAEGERFLSFWRCHRPRYRGRWHRQKAVFYVFVSVPPPRIYPLSRFEPRIGSVMIVRRGGGRYHYRPSPRLTLYAHCYHQATRPCTQGRLHGVSHHLASPMPVPAVVSVSPWFFLCGIISVAIFFVGECDFFVGKIWK